MQRSTAVSLYQDNTLGKISTTTTTTILQPTLYVRGRTIDWSSFQIAYYTINVILHIVLVLILILSSTFVIQVALPIWIVVSVALLGIQLSWMCALLFIVDQKQHRPFTRTLALAELCNAFGWFVILLIVHISRAAIASERVGEYALLYVFAQIAVYLQYMLTAIVAIVRAIRKPVQL